ncbi:MAG: DUF4349 domain-containing protein [Deltaproteobacteria bacterium]|nr:MAG: DUF4349 domain-containing protein [Deltaproteobacteria bacterium]
MSRLLFLFLLLGPGTAFAMDPTSSAPNRTSSPVQAHTAVTARFVLQVSEPTQAADPLIAQARDLEGWFQVRTQDRLELRVPVERVDALLSAAASMGRIVDRAVQRTDLTREMVEVEGQLRTRREGLQRYFEVLETADKTSVYAVQARVLRQINLIEELEGRLRVLKHRARYARVDITFRFRDRAAPVPTGDSPFDWLNTLNVQEVREGLRDARPSWKTRGFRLQDAPEGFSTWRRARRFRAASPDGVLLRARGVKHDPRASVAFWREAVRERMLAAGYRVLRDEGVQIGRLEGGRLELQAPLGDEDWTYQITFLPLGRRIAILEAAGEVGRFEGRRDAIEEMIQALDL